jgi:hypothetical protein
LGAATAVEPVNRTSAAIRVLMRILRVVNAGRANPDRRALSNACVSAVVQRHDRPRDRRRDRGRGRGRTRGRGHGCGHVHVYVYDHVNDHGTDAVERAV